MGYKLFRVVRHDANLQDNQLVVFKGDDDKAVAEIMDDLGVGEVLVRPDRYILESVIDDNSCAKAHQSAINETTTST